MLAGNGGSVLFYVTGHDARVTRRLVEFLQQSDFAGVIFTKQRMEGTFGLEQANIQSDHAPDVMMAFRWDGSKNRFGVPGMIDADWQRAAGKGTHATLSRFDMHNTLIAAGPDFKRGETDDLPSGNVDLAPTILQILAIKSPQKMDGRILSEAMTVATLSQKPETKTIEATKHFRSGTWQQSLQISRVGSTMYLDEGNGAFVVNERQPTNYSAIAERIASIGASRLNQIENDSAPGCSNIDKPFAPRAPASSAARSKAVFAGRYTQSNTMWCGASKRAGIGAGSLGFIPSGVALTIRSMSASCARTLVSSHGTASRRLGLISLPHEIHSPKLPSRIRERALSTIERSCRSLLLW